MMPVEESCHVINTIDLRAGYAETWFTFCASRCLTTSPAPLMDM
jgi:hypothetical protein